MAEVRAYECEECGDLGKAAPDGKPPDGWLWVSTEVIGTEEPEAALFCTPKCRGLHYRPIQRRKGQNGDDPEEDHA